MPRKSSKGIQRLPKLELILNNLTNNSDLIVSSQLNNNYAYLAFDELDNTYWQSQSTDANPYIGRDMLEEVKITEYQISGVSGYAIRTWNAEVSNDGESWTTVDNGTYTGGGTANTMYTILNPVKARFFRIYVLTKENASYMALTELQLYKEVV